MTKSSKLLTIGVFGRATGLTASALRFYADSGLLPPASVDEASGYRYYLHDQIERAVMIRRLREIEMPLERIAEVLDSGDHAAARIIDDHVAGLVCRANQARETAAAVNAALNSGSQSAPVCVHGSVFTTAVEQILTATTHEPGIPVLNGMHVEVSADGIVLTATDRYRLSTRTLVATRPSETAWSATVDADDLRLAVPWTRRQPELRLSRQPGGVFFQGDGTVRECRTLAEPFPDYRLMLASLPDVCTRVLTSRNALLESLEKNHGHRIRLSVPDSAEKTVTVSSKGTGDLPPITAVVTGRAITLEFAVTTLYPAISTAVGPDVMLDIAGADQPIVVRSADNGDLTTLVMPVHPESQPHQSDQK